MNMKEIGQNLIENFFYYFSTDWDNLLLASTMKVDNLYKTFIEKFNSLLNTYAPWKKNSKNKLKFKDKL